MLKNWNCNVVDAQHLVELLPPSVKRHPKTNKFLLLLNYHRVFIHWANNLIQKMKHVTHYLHQPNKYQKSKSR